MTNAIDRFLDAAKVLGREIEVKRFPDGTKTAADAGRAVGCDVGQIVKSLVFRADGAPVLALTSGAKRVDTQRLAELAGAGEVTPATAEEVRAATGFAIGGTPPLLRNPGSARVFVDETLMGFEEVWAAAGTPDAVFRLTPAELVRLSGGEVAAFGK